MVPLIAVCFMVLTTWSVTGFSPPGIKECASTPCQNGGSCIDLENKYKCLCKYGFTGTNCETDIDECASSPCQNGTTCIDRVNGYNCSCIAGSTSCEIRCGRLSETYICTGNRTDVHIQLTPSIYMETYIKEKKYRWTHEFGPFNLSQFIDPYTTNLKYATQNETLTISNISPKDNGKIKVDCGREKDVGFVQENIVPIKFVRCLDSSLSYSSTSSTTDIDECASTPCQNGGICTDGVNGYMCSCGTGYNGTNCETGVITRICSTQGIWIFPYYECVRSTLQELINLVFVTTNNPTASLVSSILVNLSRETSRDYLGTERLRPGELIAVSASLYEIAKMSNNVRVDINQVQNFIRTVSNLIDDENTESWIAVMRSANQTSTYRGASGVMKAVEEYAEAIKDTLQNGTEVKEANIVFKIQNINVTDNGLEDIHFPEREVMEEQNITSYFFLSRLSLKGVEKYSSVYFKNLSAIIPTESTHNFKTMKKHSVINGAVLSLILMPHVRNLETQLELYFGRFEDFYTDPLCSFWNFTSNGWSSEGCTLISTNSTTTYCRCQHLTNFAILMSPHKQDVSKALSIITQAGCSISVVGLAVTILLHLVLWSFVKSKRSVLLICLSTVLLIVYILFIAGVERTGNVILCNAVAVMLHYFLLTAFFLMLSSAMEIAICVLFIFAAKRNTLKFLLPCGFGIPAVIVTVTASTGGLKGYGTDTYCWLSTEHSFIWAFIGPAALVIAINIILLVLILRTAFSVKRMARKTHFQKFRNTIKCLCVLVPLMGVSWLFGMFYINDDTKWVQYVFAVCNSLQGLFIFIFQCVLNEKIREGIMLKKRKYSSSFTVE